MKLENAEVFGLKALEWLVGSDEVRGTFLGASGLSPDDLTSMVGDPDLLRSVVDFLALDDAWVMECCAAIDLPTQDFMTLQATLGGGLPNWT